MKIALAQIECTPGEVEINYKRHLFWIEEAVKQSVDLICFPELSLTGYAPSLCGELQMDGTEEYWLRFQELADLNRCIICIGYAAKGNRLPQIALRIISPEKEPRVYTKHLLHSDEKPYFEEGNRIADIHLDGKRIALAICYEAMQESHLSQACQRGADIYLAYVAKEMNGVQAADRYFKEVSAHRGISVAMVNSIGVSEGFDSAGGSSFWGEGEKQVTQDQEEDILIFEIP